jgi:polar amino acid transport system substrate-binding protein
MIRFPFSRSSLQTAALAVVAASAAVPAVARAEAPATRTPGQLTVGLSLPSEGFQVGVVKDSQVLYARGLEIDLANALAKKLELTGTTFVQNQFGQILAPGAKSWDLALAEVTITPTRATHVDLSVPYLRADQGVLLSQFVRTPPTRISGMKALRLCAQSGTTGVQTIKRTVRPTVKPTWQADVPSMMLALQLGRCDAVVYDLPTLASLKDRAPLRYGTLAGKIATGERYGVVLSKGSALTPRVNQAITALTADGTLAQLQRTWLSVSLNAVRALK